jgi:hypothetical protein
MIPESNVQNLMLRPDVVEAVAKGKFHVYPVKSIDEGIEIDPATGDSRLHGVVVTADAGTGKAIGIDTGKAIGIELSAEYYADGLRYCQEIEALGRRTLALSVDVTDIAKVEEANKQNS